MARKSKKAELRKQELISNVPLDQRRMITQPITFAYLNGDMSVMHARIQTSGKVVSDDQKYCVRHNLASPSQSHSKSDRKPSPSKLSA